MQLSAILIGSMVDPILIGFALWVFFKRSSLSEALIFAGIIAIVSFLIQATMSSMFEASFAIQMAVIKFIAASAVLCIIAYLRNAKPKTDNTEE